MDTRAELNQELRRARGWLIAVGAIMFAFDMFYIHGTYADALQDDYKTKLTLFSVALLGSFLALAYFTPRRPRLCLILGLALFWIVQIIGAIMDPSSLYQGILLKILFTLALIKGLKSANRVEDLRDELAEVFG